MALNCTNPKCNELNPQTAVFCWSCGMQVKDEGLTGEEKLRIEFRRAQEEVKEQPNSLNILKKLIDDASGELDKKNAEIAQKDKSLKEKDLKISTLNTENSKVNNTLKDTENLFKAVSKQKTDLEQQYNKLKQHKDNHVQPDLNSEKLKKKIRTQLLIFCPIIVALLLVCGFLLFIDNYQDENLIIENAQLMAQNDILTESISQLKQETSILAVENEIVKKEISSKGSPIFYYIIATAVLVFLVLFLFALFWKRILWIIIGVIFGGIFGVIFFKNLWGLLVGGMIVGGIMVWFMYNRDDFRYAIAIEAWLKKSWGKLEKNKKRTSLKQQQNNENRLADQIQHLKDENRQFPPLSHDCIV
jgi:low affinity Fe/Cu permease